MGVEACSSRSNNIVVIGSLYYKIDILDRKCCDDGPIISDQVCAAVAFLIFEEDKRNSSRNHHLKQLILNSTSSNEQQNRKSIYHNMALGQRARTSDECSATI